MIRFACFISVALAVASQVVGAAAEEPPNIVLIYADDIGYGDLGCYGAKTIPTPNIDRLASRGIRFTSGYATSATCTPSRFSLLTGEYAWRKPGRGIAPPNSTALIEAGMPTVASVLGSAGYRTGFVGKWHLGLGSPPKPDWSGEIKPGPLEIGFDECFLMPTTNDRVPCVYVRNHRIVGLDPSDPVEVYDENPDGQPTGKTQRDSLRMDWTHDHNDSIVNGISRIGFMTGGQSIRWIDERMGDVFVREAQSFLQRAADGPFFLFYSAHQAHVPRAPNARFVGATPHGPRGDAIVEFDWCVGQIVAELERIGELDSTLIVLTSDNGPVLNDGYRDGSVLLRGSHRPAGQYRGGKYSRFEGGTRVPWIAHWPQRIEPQVSDACLSQVDLLASFAALVKETPPAGAGPDSLDLLSALLGESPSGRESVIQHSGMADKLAIRQGKWKYIEPRSGPKKTYNTNTELANRSVPQLYDLSADPGERKNVYKDHPVVGKKLEEQLKEAKLGNKR